MNLLERKQALEKAREQTKAQLNAIAGQLALVEELLLAEPSGVLPPTAKPE